jgi:NADPH2:quinone reductase
MQDKKVPVLVACSGMKAIRVHQFGGPEVLQLETIPDPQPGPGQILVRVKAAGVNPVDTYVRAGGYAVKPPLPYTPGCEAAGVLENGNRVYTAGSIAGPVLGNYAEVVVCEPCQVHPLPATLTFAQGAAIGVAYGTAYRALFDRANAQPGETVLVHGASGGVGLAAVQLAVAHGCRVIGTASTERGRQLVREQGAHEVGDHSIAASPDIIIEMLANVNLARDLEVIAKGGRIVVVGNRGTVEINPRFLMAKDAAVLGLVLVNLTPAELTRIHTALAPGFANGSLRPVVGKELPLAEAARAHEDMMKSGAAGKVVLAL